MLTSLLGIRLILLIGKTVPLPAPAAVMNALKHVKVINDADGQRRLPDHLHAGQGQAGRLQPALQRRARPGQPRGDRRAAGRQPELLIDGVIYHHQIAPSNEPGMSTLTVTGRDLSVMLDLEEKNAEYKNQPDFLIVNEVLASYAKYGIVPQAMPTTDVPIELYRMPRQHETDLRFIQRMAQRNGYVFYIEPLTFGVTTAYFGPENRLGVPQPALSINMGTATNVNSLSFTNDALAPIGAKGSFVEPITKTSIPIPPLPSLRAPPLAASPAAARRTTLLRQTANQNPGQAATTALAATTARRMP